MTAGRKTTLVLGGTRSGKSDFALSSAQALDGPRVYLATAEALDSEMSARIERHRAARGPEWRTVEEPTDIEGALGKLADAGVVLIDCITLWISNLMGAGLDDEAVSAEVAGLSALCRLHAASVIMVSNEVGLGVVPENPSGRRFRDLAGLANQALARDADEVFFVASGIPVRLK